MPLPSHRLDLLIVPVQPGPAPAKVQGAFDALVAAGILTSQGLPGSRADALIAGGSARVRVDVPGGGHLYGNQAGGFRAQCEQCQATVVQQVVAAVQLQQPFVRCDACGLSQHLNEVRYRPPAAWADACLWVHDAADARLGTLGLDLLGETLGQSRIVFRRP